MTRVAGLVAVIIALTIAAVAGFAQPAGDQGARTPSTVPLSMNLKEAPLQDVLRFIAKAQASDIYMDEDVTGTISLDVSQKSPEELLDIITGAKRLYWWKDNGMYIVSGKPRTIGAATTPATPAASVASKPAPVRRERAMIRLKFFQAQDIARRFGGPLRGYEELAASSAGAPLPAPHTLAGVPAGSPPVSIMDDANRSSRPRSSTIAAVNPRSPFEQLNQIPELFTPAEGGPTGAPAGPGAEQGQGVVNASAPLAHLMPPDLTPPVAFAPLNALIVEGPSEQIEEFRKLVEMLDVRVPQVLIETQFITMSTTDARTFGIDWSWAGSETNVNVAVGAAATLGQTVQFRKGNFSALLAALQTTNRARTIQAPRAACMNGGVGLFQSTSVYYAFLTNTTTQTGTFTGSQNFTNTQIIAIPVTSQLSVSPVVNGDNSITISLSVTQTSVNGFTTGPNGEQLPNTSAISQPATLRVEDGETIVMGGFVSNTHTVGENRVPLLSDIPFIGKLFRSSNVTLNDTELLIFLTAHILPEKGEQVAAPTSSKAPVLLPLAQ